MANSTSGQLCTSFKREILCGMHSLGTGRPASASVDTLKAALYYTTASIGASTTAYSATGEVTGLNYAAGGVTVSNPNPPAINGTTSWWTPGPIVFSNITVSTAFDTVLLYNSSQSNRSILSFKFGSTTIDNGTVTLNFPTNPENALIEVV